MECHTWCTGNLSYVFLWNSSTFLKCHKILTDLTEEKNNLTFVIANFFCRLLKAEQRASYLRYATSYIYCHLSFLHGSFIALSVWFLFQQQAYPLQGICFARNLLQVQLSWKNFRNSYMLWNSTHWDSLAIYSAVYTFSSGCDQICLRFAQFILIASLSLYSNHSQSFHVLNRLYLCSKMYTRVS